jgi:hypothetical protein
MDWRTVVGWPSRRRARRTPGQNGCYPGRAVSARLSVNPAINEVYLANFNSGTIEEFPVPVTTTPGSAPAGGGG